jgi:hypothetical protein
MKIFSLIKILVAHMRHSQTNLLQPIWNLTMKIVVVIGFIFKSQKLMFTSFGKTNEGVTVVVRVVIVYFPEKVLPVGVLLAITNSYCL